MIESAGEDFWVDGAGLEAQESEGIISHEMGSAVVRNSAGWNGAGFSACGADPDAKGLGEAAGLVWLSTTMPRLDQRL